LEIIVVLLFIFGALELGRLSGLDKGRRQRAEPPVVISRMPLTYKPLVPHPPRAVPKVTVGEMWLGAVPDQSTYRGEPS